ncbi:hypothetical protein ES703_99620 [subsurface metagenome]
MVTEKGAEVTVVEQMPKPAPRITPASIEQTKQSIALLQGMVRDLLIRGVDYGRIPGTPADSLWDPGASQIIGAFNCFPGERRILKFEDTDTKISLCLEVPIISRETGAVATTGVGAASTLETKYKYRWVDDPLQCGYDEESMKTLKTKKDGAKTLYRIPNPEHSELLNTIVKMASKRAEVDGAESLPGVGSVLRQMFSRGKLPAQEGPMWNRFWAEVNRLGLTEEEVHQKLHVASMKDWLSSGKSLDQALDILRERQPAERDPDTIKTFSDLYQACLEDFKLDRQAVWEKLNVSSQEEISDTPSDCYRFISQMRE